MRGWSMPLGRWWGVELRMHSFFLLLAGVCLLFSQMANLGILRGLALWLALVLAVATRELARLLTAAWLGLRLRAILLLPIGGLFAYSTPESQEQSSSGISQWALAIAGPVANLLTAAGLAANMLGATGNISLLTEPWISPGGLLRSMIWFQAFLGIIHLFPAYPLDCGRLVRNHLASSQGQARAGRIAVGTGQLVALASIVAGFLLHSPWLGVVGFFILTGAQLEEQGVFFQSVVDTVEMREIMLTDFAILSASDTLSGALERCVHSLQDDFPVVRGSQLVGIVNRQSIVDTLRHEGDGYVQGVMSRAFQVARPSDTLGTSIRRISEGRGLDLIPVTNEGRIVGIVSVQNLRSSMLLLAEQRRLEQIRASQDAE